MEYRAEQVGSLLRSPELLRAREDHAAGRITLEELRLIEDVGILDALEMQREVGSTSSPTASCGGAAGSPTWQRRSRASSPTVSRSPGIGLGVRRPS